MAIKAIINNTEKEIEQIKNSDEQDIDYVYSRIGDTEVEGEPPISIKSIGGELANYRIYGNTVSGESVGDLIESGEHAGEYKVPVTVEGKNLVTSYLVEPNDGTQFFPVVFVEVNLQPNTEYLITFTVHENGVKLYSNDLLFTSVNYPSEIQGQKTMRLKTKTSIRRDQYINNKGWVLLRNARQNISDFTITDVKLQLVSDAPIYLPEPIKMVGDEAEYVDYGEQKLHRVRKNLLKNTAKDREIDVTFTVNSDGSVTCNGTASAKVSSDRIPLSLPAGSYYLNGTPSGGSLSTYHMFVWYYNDEFELIWYNDIGDGVSFTIDNSYDVNVGIEIISGYTCNNLTFYPMIRKADIEDDTYEPYIENTDLDVTLPALSTIKGTNTLSVNTSIQPSNMYIKDNFDYKKVFTATRAIEDELPLNYKNIEDNDSTLSDYRIYGNTVGGESVSDRTGNLFNGEWENKYIAANGFIGYSTNRVLSSQIHVVAGQTYTVTAIFLIRAVHSYNGTVHTQALFDEVSGAGEVTFTIPDGSNSIQICLKKANDGNFTPDDVEWCMLNEGSTPLPYEPYGYKVPVTVSNGTDTLTTPIYLTEPIKMVGDEAEYVDYAEQKMHRVRKNLLQNTATSQTINGVTFTVNSDGSVTCDGAPSTSSPSVFFIPLSLSDGLYIASGCPENGGANNYRVDIRNADWSVHIYNNTSVADIGSGCLFDTGAYLCIRIASGYTCDNLTFYPMIRKADIEDDTYEPYIENTDLDVTLPALPTLSGTNTLSVGTEVQPSEVYIKGKIKEIN